MFEVGDQVIVDQSAIKRRANEEYAEHSNPKGMVSGIIHRLLVEGRTNGRSKIPGVYCLKRSFSVLLEDGNELQNLDIREVKCADAALENQRVQWETECENSIEILPFCQYMAPLPETVFWEDDLVRVSDKVAAKHPALETSSRRTLRILKPDYLFESEKSSAQQNGSRIYSVMFAGDGKEHPRFDLHESDMTLVERGPVWDFYNSGVLPHSNVIVQDVEFYDRLGRTRMVVNPAIPTKKSIIDRCTWPKEAVRPALESGMADFYLPLESGFRIGTLYLPEDIEMATRVRKKMLAEAENNIRFE